MPSAPPEVWDEINAGLDQEAEAWGHALAKAYGWLNESKDATGHEHAADGRFDATPGQHDPDEAHAKDHEQAEAAYNARHDTINDQEETELAKVERGHARRVDRARDQAARPFEREERTLKRQLERKWSKVLDPLYDREDAAEGDEKTKLGAEIDRLNAERTKEEEAATDELQTRWDAALNAAEDAADKDKAAAVAEIKGRHEATRSQVDAEWEKEQAALHDKHFEEGN